MASLNKVQLIGHLGGEPEVRFTGKGTAVANLRLATTETFKGEGGVSKEKTEWHRVVLFGPQAEIAGKFLTKGSQVYIEGRIQTREWDKEGVKQYTTEIIGDDMKMLGGKRKEGAPAEPPVTGEKQEDESFSF